MFRIILLFFTFWNAQPSTTNLTPQQSIVEKIESKSTTLWLIAENLSDADTEFLTKNLPTSEIQEIFLFDPTLTDQNFAFFLNSLNKDHLTTLSLACRNFGPQSIKAFETFLSGNTKLNCLDLGVDAMDMETKIHIFNLLPSCSLENFGCINVTLSSEAAQALCNGIQQATINKLSASFLSRQDNGLMTLLQEFPTIGLVGLDLATSELNAAHVDALANSLPQSNVISLDLSATSLSSSDMRKIINILCDSQVECMKFGLDPMCYDNVKLLMEILPISKISELHLKGMGLDKSSACLLAQHLPKTDIRKLSLSKNPIGQEGLHAILNCLPNTSIEKLNLTSINVSDELVPALIEASSHLKLLVLSSDSVSEKYKKAVKESYKRNNAALLFLDFPVSLL